MRCAVHTKLLQERKEKVPEETSGKSSVHIELCSISIRKTSDIVTDQTTSYKLMRRAFLQLY